MTAMPLTIPPPSEADGSAEILARIEARLIRLERAVERAERVAQQTPR